MSFIDLFLPVELLAKVIIIIVLAIMFGIGAYVVPKGKIAVIIIGAVTILIVWFIEIEVNL